MGLHLLADNHPVETMREMTAPSLLPVLSTKLSLLENPGGGGGAHSHRHCVQSCDCNQGQDAVKWSRHVLGVGQAVCWALRVPHSTIDDQ